MAIQALKPLEQMSTSSIINDKRVEDSGLDFKKVLTEAVNNISKLDAESRAVTDDFILGKTDNIHGVLIAGERASLALQFTIEVRNKLMEAYQEIMRMQI